MGMFANYASESLHLISSKHLAGGVMRGVEDEDFGFRSDGFLKSFKINTPMVIGRCGLSSKTNKFRNGSDESDLLEVEIEEGFKEHDFISWT